MSVAERPIPAAGSVASALPASSRLPMLAWTVALCLLAIGPGARGIGYEASVGIGEAVACALFAWSVATRRSRATALDFALAFWLGADLLAVAWAYHTGWGTHSPYPARLYIGGLFGPARLGIDSACAASACCACALWPAGDPANRRIVIAPLLFAGAAVAALCALEEFGDIVNRAADPRIQATFTNPNLLGAFLCLVVPVAGSAALFGSGNSRRYRAGCIALCLFLCCALLLTQSRGAVLGCAVGMAYVAAAGWVAASGRVAEERARRARLALRTLAAGCVVIVAVGLLLFSRASRLSHSVSDDQRRVVYSAAVAMIRSQPLLGIGKDGFPAAMASLRLTEQNPDTPTGKPLVPAIHLHAHDLLLQRWVECGLPGALSVVALAWVVLARARRVLIDSGKRSAGGVAIGASGAMIAFFAQSVTDYTLWYAPVYLAAWCVLGLMFSDE